MEIFNTHLTFNRDDLYSQINNRIAEKVTGYVCVCDSSVIARLQHDLEYRKVYIIGVKCLTKGNGIS